jgi:hypothetical protein
MDTESMSASATQETLSKKLMAGDAELSDRALARHVQSTTTRGTVNP